MPDEWGVNDLEDQGHSEDEARRLAEEEEREAREREEAEREAREREEEQGRWG
jgi:hypothetical protein